MGSGFMHRLARDLLRSALAWEGIGREGCSSPVRCLVVSKHRSRCHFDASIPESALRIAINVANQVRCGISMAWAETRQIRKPLIEDHATEADICPSAVWQHRRSLHRQRLCPGFRRQLALFYRSVRDDRVF